MAWETNGLLQVSHVTKNIFTIPSFASNNYQRWTRRTQFFSQSCIGVEQCHQVFTRLNCRDGEEVASRKFIAYAYLVLKCIATCNSERWPRRLGNDGNLEEVATTQEMHDLCFCM